MATQTPKQLSLSPEEIAALKQRLWSNQLSSDDKSVLEDCIEYNLWISHAIERKDMTIQKFRQMLFGHRTEKSSHISSQKLQNNNEAVTDTNSSGAINEPKRAAKNAMPGHGRRAVNDYQVDGVIAVSHLDYKIGDYCPELCGGRLYRTKPGVQLRVRGQPLATLHQYDIETLRCNLCKKIFRAALPEDAGNEKYDAFFKANLVVQKYFGGMPFNRQEVMQKMLQFPLPASVQWEISEDIAGTGIMILQNLEYFAAQNYRCYIDDTTSKILEVMRANKGKAKKERQGMHTAGILSEGAKHSVILYYHGIKTAGSCLLELLKKRDSHLPPIIRMADALSANTPSALEATLCKCLTHARRGFVEIESRYPSECQFVLSKIAEIYRIEENTKQLSMSANERLNHHQMNSQPIMKELKLWCDQQIEAKLVEPNSLLGEAIQYVRNHWEGLTQFLRIAGAPLDNNPIERLLKIPIRIRKNSYFFKTCYSAYIASVLTSIIATCYVNKVNPVEYLIALQKNKNLIAKEPRRWMPWNYKNNFEAENKVAA